jgi:hypothetical protein
MKINPFFDRNFNLIFNRKRCIKKEVKGNWIVYDEITTIEGKTYRYLGKNTFKEYKFIKHKILW